MNGPQVSQTKLSLRPNQLLSGSAGNKEKSAFDSPTSERFSARLVASLPPPPVSHHSCTYTFSPNQSTKTEKKKESSRVHRFPPGSTEKVFHDFPALIKS